MLRRIFITRCIVQTRHHTTLTTSKVREFYTKFSLDQKIEREPARRQLEAYSYSVEIASVRNRVAAQLNKDDNVDKSASDD